MSCTLASIKERCEGCSLTSALHLRGYRGKLIMVKIIVMFQPLLLLSPTAVLSSPSPLENFPHPYVAHPSARGHHEEHHEVHVPEHHQAGQDIVTKSLFLFLLFLNYWGIYKEFIGTFIKLKIWKYPALRAGRSQAAQEMSHWVRLCGVQGRTTSLNNRLDYYCEIYLI